MDPDDEDEDLVTRPIRSIADNVMTVMVIVRLVLCTLVLLLNAFIIVAVWSRRRFHTTKSHLFVLNLAVSAFVGGICEIFNLLADNIDVLVKVVAHSRVLCHFKLFTFLFVTTTSVVVIGVIELDRYILIVYSLRYFTIMTKRKIRVLISGSWVISAVAALIMLEQCMWEEGIPCSFVRIPSAFQLIMQIVMNLMVMVIVLFTHHRIQAEAIRSKRKHQCQLQNAWVSTSNAAAPNGENEWAYLREKSVRVITQVVTCYLVLFIPVQVVLLMNLLQVGNGRTLEVAYSITLCLFILSFLVNPFLYTWRNAKLRADMYIVWTKLATSIRHAVRVSSWISPNRQMHSVRM